MLKKFPKKRLSFLPSPVEELKRLSAKMNGPRILMKRDDLTGLAFGGNKTRKLEYLVGDALAKGCDTLITGGAEQSNHCRQTAAAAAMSGLKCVLALGGEEPKEITGNLLLDKLFKAEIHWTGEYRKGEKIPGIIEELKSRGLNPYHIPYGGSNEIGALGFVNAVWELRTQLSEIQQDIDTIIFASSSGGTHAGLIVGNYMLDNPYNLIGIAIDKEEIEQASFEENILKLANETSVLLNISSNDLPEGVNLKKEFLGEGYGVINEMDKEALQLLAEHEGILLDPVYTGRAMAGLIGMIRNGELAKDQNVLFWHTGGTPSLFAYGHQLL